MNDFIQAYLDLLIYQYRDKPNASAEIQAIIKPFSDVFDLYNDLENVFDLDLAVGKQLDIIGKIVGLSRTVPLAIPKKYFGFDDDTNTYPYSEIFDSIVTYPFKELYEEEYTDLQLNDEDYRFFLKAKIAKNFAKSNILEIEEIISFLFDNLAEVIDGYNMTLTVQVDASIDIDRIRQIQQLNLLPKPQAVSYNDIIIKYFSDRTFGFDDDLSSLGFDELFDMVEAGKFAEIYF